MGINRTLSRVLLRKCLKVGRGLVNSLLHITRRSRIAEITHMNVTVDLEDYLYKKLQMAAAQRGLSFKEVLNQVVDAGLTNFCRSRKSKRSEQYKIKARACGLVPGVDYERLNSM